MTPDGHVRWWCACCPAEGDGGWEALQAHLAAEHPKPCKVLERDG